jgi:hypothetical protein
MNNSDYEINYTISINHLEALRVYSPIYDTTFDLMTTEQQKHQLDVWVEDRDKSLKKYIDTGEDTFVKKDKCDKKEMFDNFVKNKKRK